MLLTACEQFLGKAKSEIHEIALHTLEGHQRAIMGSMTVEVSINKYNTIIMYNVYNRKNTFIVCIIMFLYFFTLGNL